MQVNGLQFQNYRNLKDDCIESFQKINVIYGDNAQGKTNLLEALWLFCGGHSFRSSKDNDFIKFGEKFAKLKAAFYSQNRAQEAELIYTGGKKEVLINGVRKNSSSALIGRYNAVIFSPEDLTLVKRGPSARRRFIDSAICREKLQNAALISKYNQTLSQRNALLKDRNPSLKSTLDIWDDSLCSLGAMLIERRLGYIENLVGYASEYHTGISGDREELRISYRSTCGADFGDSREELFSKLKESFIQSRSEDISTGFTNSGPHRDDLDIIINGKKARVFSSQGQQRSAVLSLKLAEAKVLTALTGEEPVILLDDVLSELDRGRQDFLLNRISDYQVFITCCDPGANDLLKDGKRIRIENGVVS